MPKTELFLSDFGLLWTLWQCSMVLAARISALISGTIHPPELIFFFSFKKHKNKKKGSSTWESVHAVSEVREDSGTYVEICSLPEKVERQQQQQQWQWQQQQQQSTSYTKTEHCTKYLAQLQLKFRVWRWKRNSVGGHQLGGSCRLNESKLSSSKCRTNNHHCWLFDDSWQPGLTVKGVVRQEWSFRNFLPATLSAEALVTFSKPCRSFGISTEGKNFMANGSARMAVWLDSHWLGAAGLGYRPVLFLFLISFFLFSHLSTLPLRAFVVLAQVEFSPS